MNATVVDLRYKHLRLVECLAIYLIPPLLVLGDVVSVYACFIAVAVIACILSQFSNPRLRLSKPTLPQWTDVRGILMRFAVSALFLFAFTLCAHPDRLFSFPREKPQLWLMVMCLYPFISVPIQELIYRPLFWQRYATLFGSARTQIAVNAFLFAWLHIFLTPVAFVFSIVAGYFFAQTYLKTRSFIAVCFEHALYGNLIFTLGLGIHFYHGARG